MFWFIVELGSVVWVWGVILYYFLIMEFCVDIGVWVCLYDLLICVCEVVLDCEDWIELGVGLVMFFLCMVVDLVCFCEWFDDDVVVIVVFVWFGCFGFYECC